MRSFASIAPSHSAISEIDQLPGIAYRFRDPALLTQALTHRSFGPGHYERLEFLGDSLLNLVAADLLYHRRTHANEGDLSRLRSRLVRDATLAELARELDLSRYLRLGQGELRSGGFLRESILADVVEALIGAVYLDGGFEPARRVVSDLIGQRLAELPDAEQLKDPKTRLQELLQARGQPLPVYAVLAESGADHAKRFLVQCSVDPLIAPVTAEAASRRKAEQAAARRAFQVLQGREDAGHE
ncbi:MAG: ribonuclease III [Wenzhouxiangella sp.]|jgi:ribonuclease-3|nr:ribonuclease III [Wenzhouxiangella sp.]